MAQGDNLKRYLDAGVAFTQMTRDRAEAIVQDLVESGEVRRKEAQKWIEDLLERSQKNTEELLSMVRREVADQLKALGIDDLVKRAGAAGQAAATSVGITPSETPNAADDARPAPANAAIKKAAKKAAAAKAPAKKASATKGPAKKTGASKKAGAAKATKKA